MEKAEFLERVKKVVAEVLKIEVDTVEGKSHFARELMPILEQA